MPRFYDRKQLTPEQQSRFTSSEKKYEEIQKQNTNNFMAHTPGDKSALFARLLNGDKPLKFRPPCSYSYPWYSIIEDNKKHELVNDAATVKEFIYNDEKEKQVLINQSIWHLVEIVSDIELIVTYPNWDDLGFKWRLLLENIPAKESTTTIVAHYDKTLERIVTLEQLYQEEKWHIINNLKKIELILNPDKQLAHKEELKQKSHPNFVDILLASDLEYAKTMLDERREKGLSDYPSEEEIQQLTQENVKSYLDKTYTVDAEGNLFIKCWTLTKISPLDVTDIYMD